MKKSKSGKTRKRTRQIWGKVPGGITAPRGYLASGVASGIKKKGLDVAVLFSPLPASGAAVFTINKIQAAPVLLSKKHLRASGGRARAVLLNSGCANACTGDSGFRDALLSAECLASHLEIDAAQVVVASTGVIGVALPMTKFLKGISAAASALNSKGGSQAARAIMTTDTKEKSYSIEGRISGKPVRIGGMAKGSGMIHPQMATMLSVITTDVQIPPGQLSRILGRVVEKTFNCLTVDGDTSTNDMVALLANGASGVRLDSRSASFFESGLEEVCAELAKSIARDGEGATKFVEIRVQGADKYEDARRVAKTIAHSPLVKTALYGEELNWGRILCAVGYSGVSFDPQEISLSLCGIPLFRGGSPVTAMRARAEKAIKRHDLLIEVDLAAGRSAATVWTCDFSHDYVNINASYIS
jgi:glutamate N-acetyltransferase / amino-acid N-acetyltransferase